MARRRKGKDKPVIRKALVDLHGPVFEALHAKRAAWASKDAYRRAAPACRVSYRRWIPQIDRC